MGSAELLYPANFQLGESALWLPGRQELAFVDIDAGDLHLLNPEHPLQSRRLHLGDWLSAVVPMGQGDLLAASSEGLLVVDLAKSEAAVGADVDPDPRLSQTSLGSEEISRGGATGLPDSAVLPGVQRLIGNDGHLGLHRYNDAKCDRQGRLLIGTMPKLAPRTETGRLYRFDRLKRTVLDEGWKTPNALCFSPDGRWMYGCDSAIGTIWRWSYDPETGAPGKREDFAPRSIAPGGPDGATVDAEGCLWSARYNGGCVARITPDGRLDRLVELPVRQVTSVAFGGADLRTLFITTARQGLSPGALELQRLSGSIFAFDAGVSGLPEPAFALPGPHPTCRSEADPQRSDVAMRH